MITCAHWDQVNLPQMDILSRHAQLLGTHHIHKAKVERPGKSIDLGKGLSVPCPAGTRRVDPGTLAQLRWACGMLLAEMAKRLDSEYELDRGTYLLEGFSDYSVASRLSQILVHG